MSLFPNRETIDAIKKTCAAAGVEYVGVQQIIEGDAFDVVFNPPQNVFWGTLYVPLAEFSIPAIERAIKRAQLIPQTERTK